MTDKIIQLDEILDKLVKANSVITINDFQNENGNYGGFEIREDGEAYFRNLMSVFDSLSVANIDLQFLELTPKGSNHIRFKNNGGFSKYYSDLKEQAEANTIEREKEKDRQEKKDRILGIDRKWKMPLIIIGFISFLAMITFEVLNFTSSQKPTTSKHYMEQQKFQQDRTEKINTEELKPNGDSLTS